MRFYRMSGWLLVLLLASPAALGVKTHYVEHRSEKDFKEGDPNQVLVRSNGELSLAQEAKTLLERGGDVWVVNAMVKDAAGNLYVAASGNGALYRIDPAGSSELIYGAGDGEAGHVFSLALDGQGKLLAGTGGESGKLLRFGSNGKAKVVYEDEDIKYIWDIAVGAAGRIYLGTGPTGKVLTLNAQGGDAEVLYEAKEKNILSLALDADGLVYAGGDEYGLIYRIDPGSKAVSIVYDSQRGEVSGLDFDEAGNLYASTADASGAKPGVKLILSEGQSDRAAAEDNQANGAEAKSLSSDHDSEDAQAQAENVEEEPEKLLPPATPKPEAGGSDGMKMPGGEGGGPAKANEVYKISPKGYVTTLLNKKVVILALDYTPDGKLLVGTGNQGDLLSLDVDRQEAVVLHSAKPSLQVSSLLADADGTIYIGCANPGQVIVLKPSFVADGVYTSSVIDAEQISQWGKLQIEADIPEGSGLLVATRSGNTADPEKGGWQEWTADKAVGEDIVVGSRAGRFFQYRLRFEKSGHDKTAVVKMVKLAYRSPNLKPKLENLTVNRGGDDEKSEKAPKSSSELLVKWKSSDVNDDTLTHEVYLRPLGHQRWIRIAKELEKSSYKWDSLTVADGRYEMKVEVCDGASNPAGEALRHGRISEAFVVDNSGPEVSELSFAVEAQQVQVAAVMEDALSVIGEVRYCVDSGEEWKVVAAQDGVYDSRLEKVSFEVEVEESGEHLIAIRFVDALGNVTYRNLVVETP